MEEEILALEQNQTWELVPGPRDVMLISYKWVYKIKTRPDGSIERHSPGCTRLFSTLWVGL